MLSFTASNQRYRRSFAKIKTIIDLPNLIDVQKRSYERFLQADKDTLEREDNGLQGVFKSVFPIHDLEKTSSLEFVKYHLEKSKYDVDECRDRGMTYAAPVKITVRLVVWDMNEETNTRNIRDVKEQEIYLGELPLMTDTGSFIVNGTERVVVSQLHRSPGVFFDHDEGKTHSSGKLLYSARIIPNRGSWVDFEFDHKDILYVRIDRRRKLLATILLRALGYSMEEILHYFYQSETIFLEENNKFHKSLELDLILGLRADADIKHPKSGEMIVRKNRKFTKEVIETLKKANIRKVPVTLEEVLAKISSHDLCDPKSGEVLLECNEQLTADKIKLLKKYGIKEVKVLYIDGLNVCSELRDTLILDKISSTDEAMLEIYKKMRPGEPPTLETAKHYFDNLFFNSDRYNLSSVGRLKINHKFGLNAPISLSILTKEDILATVRHLVDLKNGSGVIDDIDHLGNRRVRPVGELVENQFRVGLVRMERAIRERMSLQDVEALMPHELINTKPVSAAIKEFFGSSQLSQFMDQTNPLSEVTHKRRLSALGPGGLTRERAGFEVRDVHSTHYGRICPIETPEGPNIGLIASLSTYARVNDFGFIETPYRKVKDTKVTDEVQFLTALDEEKYAIAQANAFLTKDGHFQEKIVSARRAGEATMTDAETITMMDVSPSQLVSVAAALVPFLENDDANRALMGSNMQRQAVPLLKTQSPLIGTGMERVVARDSGVTVVARNDGVVENVDATRIVVRTKGKTAGSEIDIYNLIKYRRSNQNTCVNQKPIVCKGDEVRCGDVIADGPATDIGELALGQNIIVAFMSWGGYNFEDSILVSERLMKDDTFTSIHIEEFECISRDTKLGKEEITRDIPNMSEETLKDLDSSGIIRIGAEVKPGDVLVGKVTPKGETQLSPEEKLLRAIFGEKAGNVKDSSLRVPPGISGTIIGAQVFSREGAEKDERAKNILDEEIIRLKRDQNSEIEVIKSGAKAKLKKIFVGEKTTGKLLDKHGKEKILGRGESITADLYETLSYDLLAHIPLEKSVEEKVQKIISSVNDQIKMVETVFENKIEKLKKGDELPPGVIKLVKVYVSMKRRLAVGDKMAGRHGNKGVVSRILPEEDMPYLPNGRPIDIILNPLGVPSRMNVGQILETHLGWAAEGLGHEINTLLENWNEKNLRKYLKQIYSSKEVDSYIDSASERDLKKVASRLKKGIYFSCPVFERPTEEDIHHYLEMAGLPKRGQMTLFDGRTGDAFDNDITIGIMYMMKLHHLVEDKIHARSIGPYSLVTQQPLGGKAQFGGQRLGEMEVWAMESYGAAYALQEFLTVKSDDVAGRTRIYEAIIKGENILEPGVPESFNVLIKELQSLALNVELIEDTNA